MVFSGNKYKIIIMFGVIRDEECKIKSDFMRHNYVIM